MSPRPIRAKVAFALAALILSTIFVWSSGAKAAPVDVGVWTAPIPLPGVAIHTVLLHTGEILMFNKFSPPTGAQQAWTFDPNTGTSTYRPLTRSRELFCAGQSTLPDGDVLVTGGHPPKGPAGTGVFETDVYDVQSGTWHAGPPMSQPRWYPSNIELSNGNTLIVSGSKVKGVLVPQVDEYHPSNGAMTTLPASANKTQPFYPRMHLMPSGKVFVAGPSKPTSYFDPSTNSWSAVANMTAGGRFGGTSVLLPGLQRVLAFGGMTNNGTINSAEIIDLSAATPRWQRIQAMHHPRQHVNGVLLPDGTVLAVGGGLSAQYTGPQLTPELFDPATGNWTDMAPQQATRMYHSVALLLPDGRVLSAGSDSGDPLQKTAEIYSPPYLFKGARPVIGSAPSQVGYGRPMSVQVDNAATVSKMVLMRPGSVTHSVNIDQRSVALPFTKNGNTLTTTSPANGNIAPPGWYMLFLVSPQGVPSVARWVQIGG